MREQILELIQNHPKHYSLLIKKNSELLNWVRDNSLLECDHFPTMIWSAVYSVDPRCQHGQLRKIVRWTQGLTNCGPASICSCTKSTISTTCSNSKLNYSAEEKKNIESKRISTMIEKYGVAYNSQRENIKTKLRQTKLKKSQYDLLIDKDWLRKEYVDKKRTAIDIAEELECHDSAVRRYVALHGYEVRNYGNRSRHETKICNLLDNHNIQYEICNRTLLNGPEVDIYIPKYSLAIEVNGLLYHGYNPDVFHILRQKNTEKRIEQRNKHLDKTILAEQVGVQLLHFTDYAIINKWDIVANIIGSKLGLHTKIGARKCVIRQVDTLAQKQFFDSYHLQGYTAARSAYGLYYNNRLVQCISIGQNRFRKNELEIIRFASEHNITIVGGLSKLLKCIRTQCADLVITTYCDRDISTGAGYRSAGFQVIEYTKPGYFWTDGRDIISRYRTQKKQLANWLNNYDPNESESVNMFRAGYLRYWNTGNIVLRYYDSLHKK